MRIIEIIVFIAIVVYSCVVLGSYIQGWNAEERKFNLKNIIVFIIGYLILFVLMPYSQIKYLFKRNP